MVEVSPVAKFNIFCGFANSEVRKLFSKHVHFVGSQKHFRDVPSWYLLLHLAALNENITFRLCSFSFEDDS